MSLNILIIEDDPLMQLGLRHALGQDSSFSIVGQATDGAAGVQQAMQLNPHLVIMDIGLPHLDGIEATHQIKAACPDTRIVILTSHATEHETALALANVGIAVADATDAARGADRKSTRLNSSH